MCLGLTCQVTAELGDGRVLVRDGARVLEASLLAHDEPVRAGDWVLVHAGFVLASLSERQAREALALRATTQREST